MKNTGWIIFGVIALLAIGSALGNSNTKNANTVPTANSTGGTQPVITQADKDRCEIQAQEYAYAQGQAVIAASDAQTRAMGGYVLSEGDPTKVDIYQPDLQRSYLNCIDNTNY